MERYAPTLSSAPGRPSPPVNLNSSDQTQSSVQLTWEPPLKDGGSPVLGYVIERCEEGEDNWIRCNKKLVPELTYKVGYLHLKIHSVCDHGLNILDFYKY